jgi:hypothetical protein
MLWSRFASVAMVLAAPVVVTMSAAGAQTAKPGLIWTPCDDVPGTECAGLPVPIDYAAPDGAKIRLRVARAPAVDSAKRKVDMSASLNQPSRSGNYRGPRTIPADHVTTASGASSNCGNAASHSWSATTISMRAKLEPMQQ